MKAVLQRVQHASVTVDGKLVGQIEAGLLVLVCAEHGDDQSIGQKLIDKIVKLRVFPDDQGKMNRSLLDIQGQLLIVSQFTLAADISKGNRPSYVAAAPPELAQDLYERFIEQAQATGLKTESGLFGADMKVSLINDGPVTIPISMN